LYTLGLHLEKRGRLSFRWTAGEPPENPSIDIILDTKRKKEGGKIYIF